MTKTLFKFLGKRKMIVNHSIAHSVKNYLKHLIHLNSILELTQEGNLSSVHFVASHTEKGTT